jgi:PGF-pre-PGF domain-containing protein
MKKKRNTRLAEHELFWLVLIIILVLPLVGVIDLNAFSGSLEGRAIQTVGFVKEGSQIHMDIKDVEGVRLLYINFKEDTKGSIINVEDISMVSWTFDGKVYSRFRISCGDADKIKDVEITLKLKEKKLIQIGLAKQDVKLYAGGEVLDTKLTKSEGDYVYYKAVSDELGEFVIGREIVKKESITEKAEEIPLVLEEEEPSLEEPMPVSKGVFSKIIYFFKNLLG